MDGRGDADDTTAAVRHLADLVDAALTTTDPFETASKATVLGWLKDPQVGARLEKSFFVADHLW